MSATNKAPDLSLLLMRSIVKAQERKRSERIWTEEECAGVSDQIEAELWRVAIKAVE